MINVLLNSSRKTKRTITILYDALAIPLAIYSALALRHGQIWIDINSEITASIFATTVLTIFVFIRLGFYRSVIRFMTQQAFSSLIAGILISALFLGTASFLVTANIPRSSIIIYIFSGFALLGAPRLFIRSIVEQFSKIGKEPVMIYGAGHQGIELINSLNSSISYLPSVLIDDDRRKQGSVIHGLKVRSPNDIEELVKNEGYKKILLAVGTASNTKRKALIEQLSNYNLEILTTPSVQDILSGKAKIEEVKNVELEDLLGRDCVQPNSQLLQQCIEDKRVLITGAGGSIGSELCRQALLQKPKLLVLFELNEYSLYSIERELQETANKQNIQTKIVSILGSVQKQTRMETLFKTFGIQTIYHAAAYKHVPLVEHNVVEGVRNNIFGTWFCAEAAINAGVEKFVLISTDKAVRPTNVMGASKRMSELVLQALSQRQSDTQFCMVRFGNVLGSSGSVIPLFRQQIQQGGPITVTHPDIIRYFMTIPEASQLVIQAGSMAKGGDVFVLDMGEPVKILDLAKQMIRLSGLTEKTESTPDGDIAIEFTGLRPGEKLYEELLIGDNVQGSNHPRIMCANETHLSWPETHNFLHKIDKACHDFDVEKVIALLSEAPTAFKRSEKLVDWVTVG